MTSLPYQVMLGIEAENLHVQVDLNDISVSRKIFAANEHLTLPVSTFCCHGPNTLSVRLLTGREAKPRGWIKIQMQVQEFGAAGLLATVNLGQWAWGFREEDQVDDAGILVRGHFDIAREMPVWNWMKARNLTPAFDAQIQEAIRDIHAAFATGDASRLSFYLQPQFEDEAIAYGVSLAQQMKILQASLDRNRSRNRRLIPLDLRQWDLRRCASGRLMEAVTTDGKAIVRAEGEGDRNNYYFKMLLGFMGERAQIFH